LSASEVQRIAISAPHHPLYGQAFPVLRQLYKEGERQFVILLPDGASQLIPARWTLPPAPPAGRPLCGADRLRMLVRLVAALRRQHPEAPDERFC